MLARVQLLTMSMWGGVQEIRASVELVRKTKVLGRLPVVNFAAGGVATPADAALMMQVRSCALCASPSTPTTISTIFLDET